MAEENTEILSEQNKASMKNTKKMWACTQGCEGSKAGRNLNWSWIEDCFPALCFHCCRVVRWVLCYCWVGLLEKQHSHTLSSLPAVSWISSPRQCLTKDKLSTVNITHFFIEKSGHTIEQWRLSQWSKLYLSTNKMLAKDSVNAITKGHLHSTCCFKVQY